MPIPVLFGIAYVSVPSCETFRDEHIAYENAVGQNCTEPQLRVLYLGWGFGGTGCLFARTCTTFLACYASSFLSFLYLHLCTLKVGLLCNPSTQPVCTTLHFETPVFELSKFATNGGLHRATLSTPVSSLPGESLTPLPHVGLSVCRSHAGLPTSPPSLPIGGFLEFGHPHSDLKTR